MVADELGSEVSLSLFENYLENLPVNSDLVAILGAAKIPFRVASLDEAGTLEDAICLRTFDKGRLLKSAAVRGKKRVYAFLETSSGAVYGFLVGPEVANRAESLLDDFSYFSENEEGSARPLYR